MSSSTPFSLGTFSVAEARAFAGIVVDERDCTARAQAMGYQVGAAAARRVGAGRTRSNWTHNFAALQAIVAALDMPTAAGITKAAVPVALLRTQAPW